jgi:hypothetical protein
VTAVEIATVIYLVIGLGMAARIFDGVTGGWEAEAIADREAGRPQDKESELGLELLSHTRAEHPARFGTLLGLLLLVLVLVWPLPAVWFGALRVAGWVGR